MSKLTTKSRETLPDSKFGEPAKRAYPMPDASHAKNAKARAAQAQEAGRLTVSERRKIDAKADRIISKDA